MIQYFQHKAVRMHRFSYVRVLTVYILFGKIIVDFYTVTDPFPGSDHKEMDLWI